MLNVLSGDDHSKLNLLIQFQVQLTETKGKYFEEWIWIPNTNHRYLAFSVKSEDKHFDIQWNPKPTLFREDRRIPPDIRASLLEKSEAQADDFETWRK